MAAQLQCLDEGLEPYALQRDVVSLFARGVRICHDAHMDDMDAFSLGFTRHIRHLVIRVAIVFKEPIRHDDREDPIVDGNDDLIGEMPGFSVSVSQCRCLQVTVGVCAKLADEALRVSCARAPDQSLMYVMLRPGEMVRRLHELREQSFDFSIRPVLQEGRDAELEDQECPRADHQDAPAPGGFLPFVGPFVVTEQVYDHQ